MRRNTPSSLWANVDVRGADECWPWTGNCNGRGYGIISIDGKNHATHRLAHQIVIGDIPEGHFVCHSCDNPPCCNPRHLFAGSPALNSHDAAVKGRMARRPGSRHHLAKLNEEQVAEIRRRLDAGERNGDLAAAFGVSRPTITRISKREGWVHV